MRKYLGKKEKQKRLTLLSDLVQEYTSGVPQQIQLHWSNFDINQEDVEIWDGWTLSNQIEFLKNTNILTEKNDICDNANGLNPLERCLLFEDKAMEQSLRFLLKTVLQFEHTEINQRVIFNLQTQVLSDEEDFLELIEFYKDNSLKDVEQDENAK